MRTGLLIAGSLLPVSSALIYIISILKGKSKPQRMTRFLLVVITTVMTASLWAASDRLGVWLALVSWLQALCIWILSFRHGVGGGDRLDLICLALCVLGLGLWLLSSLPWIGLVASIVADLIASLPALRKTIRLPHTELALFYGLDAIAGVLVLLASLFNPGAVLFPAYIAAINFVFVVAIKWPRSRAATVLLDTNDGDQAGPNGALV